MLIYRYINNDRLPRQTDKKQKEDKLEQSKNQKNAVELVQGKQEIISFGMKSVTSNNFDFVILSGNFS